MTDDVCPVVASGGTPPAQGAVRLQSRRLRRRLRRLGELWCDVIDLAPRLSLYWRYTAQQAAGAPKWEAPALWLHSVSNDPRVLDDAQEAVNLLVRQRDGDSVRYSLLVSPEGMFYDANRCGGDWHVTVASGRHFTFSVRRVRDRDEKVLLAIAWN